MNEPVTMAELVTSLGKIKVKIELRTSAKEDLLQA